MRIHLTAFVLVAMACGSPVKRQDCSGPGQCPAGQYCAPENICWPDATPPTVGAVSASCAAPCARDGVVRVSVQAADESRMGSVRVRLDLDPARAVTLPKTATGWEGDVPLAPFPFPGFEAAVAVTVEAVDEAGNFASRPVPGSLAVTRLKWVYEAGGSPAAVAVYPDGSVLLPNGSPDRLARIDSNGVKVWAANVGASEQGVPSIGDGVAWVGNAGGAVLAIGDDGAVLNGAGCATGGTPLVPPAIATTSDVSFAPSQVRKLFAVPRTDGTVCKETQVTQPYEASPAIRTDGAIVAASNGTASLLRSFSFSVDGFSELWSPPPEIGVALTAAPAIDAQSRTWTATSDGNLNATTAAGATTTVKQVGANPTAPVILSDGSVVLGDASSTLQRYRLDGSSVWATPPALGAVPQTPLVLTGGAAVILVPTAGGKLVALEADGTEAWSTQLAPVGASLRPGNIFTPAGSTLSLGYFPASNGKLYAVVLDGRLDASAPWPKAFHDPRNTGNAATPIP